MKQKIKTIVAVALLSMVVLGMTTPALSASAATGSVNDDCNHPYVVRATSEFLRYTNVSATQHEVEYRRTYVCGKCRVFQNEQIEREPENHKQVSGTSYCICGYYLR